MSLLADSSPPPKQLSKSGGFNCNSFPSNSKHPKLDDFRSYRMNCCASPACPTAPSNVEPNSPTPSGLDSPNSACAESPSTILARDFPEIYAINGRVCEFSGNVKKPRLSYGAPIAAAPLRSLPSTNVECIPEKLVPSPGYDDDVGENLANNENTDQQEASWERDTEKLAEIIAEAKKFINLLDGRYSVHKSFDVAEEEKVSGMETEGEEDEGEVRVLSPAEWSMLSIHHKGDDAKALIGQIEEKIEKCSSHKSCGKFCNMAKSQGTNIVDFVGLRAAGTKSSQQSEMVPDCELTETTCGEEHQEQNVTDFDSKYCENHNELINLQIGKHDQPQHFKVLETLKLFEEQYSKLLKERTSEFKEGKIPKPAHTEAGERVKEMGKCISIEKPFGHIPGIEIGDALRFRAELVIVGLHRQLVAGIDYVSVNGKKCATSVVDGGQYDNSVKTDDILIYSGHGGNSKIADNASDQKLERGNLALVNSKDMGFPVRVIYKRRNLMACKTLSLSDEREFVYVYDGLYTVNDHWQERGEKGRLVFKFELCRLSGQPRPRVTNARLGKPIKRRDVCVVNDVSQGKEKFPVRAMNGVDDDLPPPFTYITKIVYPHWYQRVDPTSCNCTDGCSDSQICPCVLKNGVEIPYNEEGDILRVKPRGIYECGPSCKCPPSCMNRVSQHGPRYQLEIFKTESRGWGVRSRSYISQGSFICEYVGELLREKEAEQRIGNDEYLFDICKSQAEGEEGFAVDAAMFGNIGRFINHSCSPNLFTQEVFYDHDDKRMPHIMFFASKNIRHSQELTYDYNYKDPVCDANGNIKNKVCYCGHRSCTHKMY